MKNIFNKIISKQIIDYKNGTVRIETLCASAEFITVRVIAEIKGITYCRMETVSSMKWVFIRKTQDEYEVDVIKAYSELLSATQRFIDKLDAAFNSCINK